MNTTWGLYWVALRRIFLGSAVFTFLGVLMDGDEYKGYSWTYIFEDVTGCLIGWTIFALFAFIILERAGTGIKKLLRL